MVFRDGRSSGSADGPHFEQLVPQAPFCGSEATVASSEQLAVQHFWPRRAVRALQRPSRFLRSKLTLARLFKLPKASKIHACKLPAQAGEDAEAAGRGASRAVLAALEALEGLPWQLLVAPPGPAAVEGPGAAAEGPPPQPPAQSAGAAPQALVVLSRLGSHARDLIKEANAAHPKMPVVVAFFDVSKTDDVGLILDVQRRLQDAGADEVFISAAADRGAIRREFALAVGGAARRRLERRVIQKAERGALWRDVHMLLEGFPPVDPVTTCAVSGREAGVGSHRLGLQLGAGAYARVYEATDQATGRREAIKIFTKGDVGGMRKVRDIWQEVSALRRLQHPGIVAMLGCTHTPRHFCLHMEMVGRRTLWSALEDAGQGLEPSLMWSLCSQVAQALAYCHSSGIVHKDVKTQNIVLAEDGGAQAARAKLVDFGLSANVGSEAELRCCGTVPFMAPEVLCGSMQRGQGAAADVWAHGAVVLETACGNGRCNDLLAGSAMVPGVPLAEDVTRSFGQGREAIRAALAVATLPIKEQEKLLTLLLGEFQVSAPDRWSASQVAQHMELQRELL